MTVERSNLSLLRWQFIVLGIGLLLIIGAGVYLLVSGSRAPDVPDVPLLETQTYAEAVVGEPLWVNPLLAVSRPDRDLASLIYSGLTRLNQYGEPVPDLAESWAVSDDGLIYIFKLRTDVTWHDGMPFTAADVDFTMRVLRDPDFPGPADSGAFWRTVETYADDESTIRFILTQPLAAFPEYAGIGILPAHALSGTAPAALPSSAFNLSPVGTGRMQWSGISEEGRTTVVRLTPNPNFYDAGHRVGLDEIAFHYYDDGGDAFRALGEVQGMGGLSSLQLEAVLQNPDLNVYSAPLPSYVALVFNQRNSAQLSFFQEVEVRQALVMTLDRRRMVEEVLGRSGVVAETPVLPALWAFDPSLDPLPYDPDQAAQLLNNAGWVSSGGTRSRDGVPMRFRLIVSGNRVDRELGRRVVAAWTDLGLDVTLDVLDPGEVADHLAGAPGEEGRDFDVVLAEFGQGGHADPDPYSFWHETQYEDGQNFGGAVDYDISRALETARKESNGVRRYELYQEFQRLFVEHATAVLLYHPTYHYAVTCQIQGVQLSILADPSDRFRNLHEWRILSPQEFADTCS